MSYKTVRFFVISILIIYLLAGLSLRVFKRISPNQEIYPFFSWKLFSDVPQPTERIFKIRIIAEDGKYISDPYFYLSSRLKSRDINRPTWEEDFIIDSLGESLVNENEEEFIEFRKLLEEPFGTSSITYEVVEFNPSGEEVLGTFTSGDLLQ